MDLQDNAFREIIELAKDAVIVTESTPIARPGPRIVYVNNALCNLTGYKPEELLGNTPRLLQGSDTCRETLDEIHSALNSNASIRAELLNYHKTGYTFWVDMIITPICYTGEIPKYFASIQRDITEHKRLSEGLEYLAEADHLTNISNRRAFDLKLESEWQNAKQNKSAISLIYVDIDNFKLFNDKYGHQCGDEALRHVAKCLSSQVRSSDMVARIGGDEFAILLRNCPPKRAVNIAESIRKKISNEGFYLDNEEHQLSVSLGVGSRVEKHDSVNDFIYEVDDALYKAKSSGRNCAKFTELTDDKEFP